MTRDGKTGLIETDNGIDTGGGTGCIEPGGG